LYEADAAADESEVGGNMDEESRDKLQPKDTSDVEIGSLPSSKAQTYLKISN